MLKLLETTDIVQFTQCPNAIAECSPHSASHASLVCSELPYTWGKEEQSYTK